MAKGLTTCCWKFVSSYLNEKLVKNSIDCHVYKNTKIDKDNFEIDPIVRSMPLQDQISQLQDNDKWIRELKDAVKIGQRDMLLKMRHF